MSSDSSDEENLQFLREATDACFINDSMFKGKPANQESYRVKPTESLSKTLPSLRKNTEEDDQFNIFHVTPEFQEFVGKRLSKIIEERLEVSTKKKPRNIEEIVRKFRKNEQRRSGVRLLRSSRFFLNSSRDEQLLITNPLIRRKPSAKSKVQVSPEALKQIAVDSQTVLSKKDTLCWSNRFKAKNFFSYRKNKQGILELVGPE